MLVNLRDIMAIAEQKNMAIAAFDTPSLEGTRAAIEAAEQTGQPIIIAHAEGHNPIVPLDVIGPIMVDMAEKSSALICVDLDHCENFSTMIKAMDIGFTGAMYDGSMLPYETNIENSQRAADIVSGYDCGLECELGCMGTRENGAGHENDHVSEAIYTDPDQAAEFIDLTGLDCLACSFGTVHGIYKGEPKLSFDVLEEIRKKRNVPLVMHGGSGVSDSDYRHAINSGIRKVNYFTYGVKAAGEAAFNAAQNLRSSNPDAVVYWQDMTIAAYEAFRSDCESVINVLSNES